MSEEEKNAIECLKWDMLDSGQIDIIINLIEKQQEEIVRLNRKQADDEMLTDTFIERDYISKDKIRELQDKYKNKIERLESKKIWNEPVDTINKNRYTNYFNAFEELLEEN